MRKIFALLISGSILFSFQREISAYHVRGKKPYDYKALEEDLDYLKREYGDVLKIKGIGESHFGKRIWAIRLGKGKEEILLIGAHHGREWLTANLLMMMCERYAHAYQKGIRFGRFNTDIFDKIAIVFVPMVNPDGIEIQQGNIPEAIRWRFIKMNEGRKDFSRWKANGRGVDLNRQYPAGWKAMESPTSPSYKFYKGKRPLEAKEVRAIVRYTKKTEPLAAVSYHSSGREIFWRYGKNQHVDRDYRLALKLSYITGYALGNPPENAVGAGYTDWFIETYRRPGFTLEICKPVEETNPPVTELSEEWMRNQFVGILLADEMAKLKWEGDCN